MEQKTARLTLLIDPDKKAAFDRLCASQDVTPSQVVRRLIREYLAAHGVQYLTGGAATAEPARSRKTAARKTSARTKSRRGGSAA